MTIKIFSNAKGLQNNNYNMIRLCKLGNIIDYIYIYIFFLLIYEISIGVTPPVLLTKFNVCLHIHCIILYIFSNFILILLANPAEIMMATYIFVYR